MKVYISSDMEGTAGVVDWDQCTPGRPRYPEFAELLTNEINAAIEGAREAGAQQFVVNDSHSTMQNLHPARLSGRARLVSGRYKPMYMMEGLDDSFDAIFLISYHGPAGAGPAVLSHTYSSKAIAEVRIDGALAGEAGVNALVADALGVPIVLVTGDQATAEEASGFCPGVRTAVVKTSISGFAAESLHPDEACELIRSEARLAVQHIGASRRPYQGRTVALEVRFVSADHCDLAARIAGVRRTGPRQARLTGDSNLEVYRTFVTVLYLCRGLQS